MQGSVRDKESQGIFDGEEGLKEEGGSSASEKGMKESDEIPEQQGESDDPPTLGEDPVQFVPPRVETTARLAAVAVLSYALAYAGTDGSISSIPPSLAWLVGVLGVAIASRVPTIAAVPLVLSPAIYVAGFFALGATTALLCAAAVSSGLFVACSAILTLWISGLRYGIAAEATNIIAPTIVVIYAMVGLGIQPMVTDGVSVVVSSEKLQQLLSGDVSDLPTDYLKSILEAIRLIAGSNGIDFCYPAQQGFFEGQNVCVEFLEGQGLKISVEGGLWVITRLWTTSGLTNPLAFFQNFIVAAGWSILCGCCVAPLLPPLRTSRYMISQLFVPMTLRETSWFMRRRFGNNQDTTKDELKVQNSLVDAVNVYKDGMIAAVTAFEPRLLDYRPCATPECTWKRLVTLVKATEYAAIRALVLDFFYPQDSSTTVEDACTTYEECASALEQRALMKRTAKRMDREEEEVETATATTDPLAFEEMSNHVADSATDWVESLQPDKANHMSWKDATINVAWNVGPWLLPSVLFIAKVFVLIPLHPLFIYKGKEPFDPMQLWSEVKFTIGFTALVCMTVYWDAYRNAELNGTGGISGIQISNTVPSSFAGWHLIAYSFATMPTTEGTIKKCIYRLIGTCSGALSAFGLFRVTNNNSFGAVAWLVVTDIPFFFITFESGVKSRLGPSKDFGYGGFYFVLTQTVIVMEGLVGSKSDDELVANRVVSNCVGIAMAVVMALIPPCVMGSNPTYAKRVLVNLKEATIDLSEIVLNKPKAKKAQHMKELQTKSLSKIKLAQSTADDLLVDAKRGTAFPCYKVDPRLDEQLKQLTISTHILSFLVGQGIEGDEEEFVIDQNLREEMKATLNAFRNLDKPPTKDGRELVLLSSDDKGQFFVKAVQLLQRRIAEHESVLSGVRWASISRCKKGCGRFDGSE